MPTTFIVCIGVGQTADGTLPSLRFAARDAHSMHAFLCHNSLDFSVHHILLTDELASYDIVHSVLFQVFAAKARPDSTIFFYFSGHGLLDRAAHTAYLGLWDSKDRRLGINVRELRALIEETAAQRVIAVLDACHSAAAGQDEHALTSNALSFRTMGQDMPGTVTKQVITSISVGAAWERPEYRHSVFTYHLLRRLRLARRHCHGATLNEIYDAVAQDLSVNGFPMPTKFGFESGRTLLVSRKRRRSHLIEMTAEASSSPDVYPLPGDVPEFIRDVSYPDGSVLPVGSFITKTWEIRNAGVRHWSSRFLRCFGATRGTGLIEAPPVVPIPDVPPGQHVQVSVPMRMPSYPGTCHIIFKIVDAYGRPCFPAHKGIFATLNVVDASVSPHAGE